jgi:hypothetical protein
MTVVAPDVLATTRRSLHGVAEGIVAGPQYRAAGTMRLRSLPGGFGTVVPHGDLALVAVDGTDLVLTRVGGDSARWRLAGTFGELAEATGLPFGGLAEVYSGGANLRPDESIEVDAAAAAVLAAAWATGDAALRALGGEVATQPPEPVLWPEHFDIGSTVDEINYGVSPGDGFLAEPYAYVGPWQVPAGPFWNAPFGAARPLRDTDADAVLGFFQEGRAVMGG